MEVESAEVELDESESDPDILVEEPTGADDVFVGDAFGFGARTRRPCSPDRIAKGRATTVCESETMRVIKAKAV